MKNAWKVTTIAFSIFALTAFGVFGTGGMDDGPGNVTPDGSGLDDDDEFVRRRVNKLPLTYTT